MNLDMSLEANVSGETLAPGGDELQDPSTDSQTLADDPRAPWDKLQA